ncbi:WG repeat-containing protein [Cohnella yongneupensis]|uniref:WG repeat-containing protein n=1 Tax=Cohnella yongneupensis TaxID=425006 RepID=A0ABW0R4V6_9BACL
MRVKRYTQLIILILLCSAFVVSNAVFAASKPELLFPFVQNDKVGYINKNGKIIIPAKFDTSKYSYEVLAPESNLIPQPIGKYEDAKWGYIDRTGKFVIQPQYDYASKFENGVAKVGTARGEAWINEAGDTVISGHYAMTDFGAEGYAIAADLVGYDEKGNEIHTFNFIDRNGENLSDRLFAGVLGFSEGLAAVNIGGKSNIWGFPSGGKWGYLDTKGQMAIEAKFEFAFSFVNGLAGFNVGGKTTTQGPVGGIGIPEGGKWGYIDKSGAVVIKPQFQDIGSFSDGVAPAMLKDKWGIIDTKGKFVAKPVYWRMDPIGNGLFIVANDADYSSYGVLSKTGKIIGNHFTEIGSKFSDGLLHVFWGDTGAFMDPNGKMILKRKGVRYGDFRNGLSTYSYTSDKKHLRGLMDRQGTYLTKPIFSNINDFYYGLALVSIPDAKGNSYDAYIDAKGKIVWKSKIPR